MLVRAGRHFLQIPGPTNVPDRVLQAMARPTIDHRGPQFAALGRRVLEGIRTVFKTSGPVVIYPSSGTGAWEAALVNTHSPGDAVLMYETGQFSTLWATMATRLGLDVEVLEGNWRTGVDAERIQGALEAQPGRFRSVAVVHNETSTGVTSDIEAVRRAMDAAGSEALLLVDTISSLGSIDYRHDEWGADVTVCGSQKGLMLPPGLGFNAISDKARAAAADARLPRSYWDWEDMLASAPAGMFPYTPATNLLYGLAEAIDLLHAEGLDAVFARHDRHAEATRRAVEHWGLELWATVAEQRSSVLTAVLLPDGHDADEFRRIALERFDLSLGAGLARLAGKVFRIGHLGDLNDLTLAGTLAGVEAALGIAGVPIRRGGVEVAMERLAAS
ncbi:alanine--glyoxylate aminotransferase family protein [Egicoccus sp. AB-alg6-2]|uniref:pyridoxal-phosphate-dependent aminotransferase family protein n=1 Tax=Egicoccus sp. AB-alg6-2 TaxID=3242692 RepID=UPI00359EDF12